MVTRDGKPGYEGPLYFNGVNGTTGRYGLELTVDELSRVIDRKKLTLVQPNQNLAGGRILRGAPARKAWRGVKSGVDTKRLDQAGWGIVFAWSDDPAEVEKKNLKKEALDKLVQHRKNGGAHVRLFEGSDAYRPGESARAFLERFKAQSGPVDPELVPYYLLLVGSPEQIPFEFQYMLDVDYAVGRLDFPAIKDYEKYAAAVVAAESAPLLERPRRIRLFGVTNPDDPTTRQTTDHLIKPLNSYLRKTYASAIEAKSWDLDCFTGEDTTRDRLGALLGEEHPDLLVTASHGVEFSYDDPRQRRHQGALLCREWQPNSGRVPEDFYFAGDHLSSTTNLQGLITFHYACYAAGTPIRADLGKDSSGDVLTDKPFVAALPQSLLSRGALAVVGHVDRAYGYSFMSSRGEDRSRIVTFSSALDRLLAGEPLGRAMEDFNNRYSSLAANLLNEFRQGLDLVDQWTEHYDARNYVILGDPAVRLPAVRPRPPAFREGAARLLATEKPLADLDDSDWRQTPPAVQRRLTEAVELIRELRSRLEDWEK